MSIVKFFLSLQTTVFLIVFCNAMISLASDSEVLPAISLNIEDNNNHREYLGLADRNSSQFVLSDIDADILLIEIFNMYCPFCQAEAFKVNELYKLMQEQEQEGIKMRIVGLGVSNTGFEVNHFKETFNIEFPLFPDKNMAMYKLLGGKGTPEFIGCLLQKGKEATIVMRESGGFDTAEEFLGLLLQRAGYR